MLFQGKYIQKYRKGTGCTSEKEIESLKQVKYSKQGIEMANRDKYVYKQVVESELLITLIKQHSEISMLW